ncbi:MAG: 3-deoxy-manno-octulosonate cytidylyltransferase [Alphaproteobacteria bacterium]|nr:3-deoxy-manno-octulosonate cytidylyltransferase [Alphaproteobacteria bacterium]
MTIRPLIVIPARLAATRLPEKPLAMIGDVPMIVHVWRRAVESGIGDVLVACDSERIAAPIRQAGGVAVLTDANLPSGSDRVWAAIHESNHEIIINLQGDLPTLEPQLLSVLLDTLSRSGADIATLAAPITRAEEHTNPSVVKAVIGQDGRALYFTRATAPHGEGARYHHIGIYAYKRDALRKFIGWAPSPLEIREKLEQLRALENGLQIAVSVVDTVPLGVDTPEDLERAREMLVG